MDIDIVKEFRKVIRDKIPELKDIATQEIISRKIKEKKNQKKPKEKIPSKLLNLYIKIPENWTDADYQIAKEIIRYYT